MVPIETINFKNPVCNVSVILSKSFVTLLKISPALFWSKNLKGNLFNFSAICLRKVLLLRQQNGNEHC